MRDQRALLMTDVIDSTRLSARLGDAAAADLWRDHDRCARDLLQAWSGREIDKSDGFLMLFAHAGDAAGYVGAYHRALAALPLPLQARAGLHVGPVELRSNPAADVARGAKPVEVEGLAKSVAARVMSVARGGQTLATAAACAALPGGRARSHGHWRFKGLDEPIEVFEVGDADTSWQPPMESAKAYRVVRSGDEWIAAREMRHNLPAERDRFIDRLDELRQLTALFDGGARLVSVLGPGGAGKTRLALRYARTWLGDFDGGAWFCDLSQASSAADVAQAVARGLELDLQGADPLALTTAALDGRGHCLVLLDNFEQVGRHAEATLGPWLERAPRARFLVTSRERLHLAGEHVLALDALPAAAADALFRERAMAACGDAIHSPADERAIAPLVELLDGMPLAIELAAARTRVMPPQMLLARMGERFQLLTSARHRHDRQATLRATFDWSWDLLLPPERLALAQLSVFEGGASLAAIEAVVDAGAPPAPRPLDLLQSLVEKSLVRQVSRARFALLHTVQDYARERMQSSGLDEAVRSGALARHARHFAALGAGEAVAERCVELHNLVAAVTRSVALGLHDTAVGALQGAWEALRLRGPFATALALAQQVAAMPGLAGIAAARVALVWGWVLKASGLNAPARERLQAALDLAGNADEVRAELLRLLPEIDTSEGQAEAAQARLDQALAIARTHAAARLECQVLCGLGALMIYQGRHEAAAGHYGGALAIAGSIGDRHLEGSILSNMALIRDEQGRAAEALGHYEAALAIAREVGDRRREGNNLCNLGLLQHLQGRAAEAQPTLEAALQVARDIGHARLESIVLCNLALAAEGLHGADAALAHYQAALRVARAIGDRRAAGQILGHMGLLHARCGRVGPARESLATGEQLLAEVADRPGLALLLCQRAEAEHLGADAAGAQRALAAASALARDVGAEPQSELGARVALLSRLLEAAPGPRP